MPDFSVVVPLYNKEKYIARCLSSILGQTLPPAEIIVVDDGSIDDGVAVVKGLEHKAKITILRQENAGAGPARNRGIRAAASEWVAFLDADDYWLPHHLEELSRVIEQHPEAALVSTSFISHPSHGGPPPAQLSGDIARVAYFRERSRNRPIVWTSNVAVRREVLNALGGFGAFMPGQDTHLWIRVALEHEIAASSGVTAVYSRGTGGISDTRRSSPRADPINDLLVQALSDPRQAHRREDLTAFLNARLFTKVKGFILASDVEAARTQLALTREVPRTWRLRLAEALLRLPDGVVRAVGAGAGRLRQARSA